MLALQTAAFVVLALISLLRLKSAFHTPRARFSWLASMVGACAMLTLGSVIPLRTLDGLLGGSNLIYLFQNLLSTCAFWLVAQATVAKESDVSGSILRRLAPLGLSLAAITISFFFIRRGPTTSTFIHDNTDQVAAVLCASVYLVSISAISIRLISAVRQRRIAAYWPFIAGGCLVVIAAANEIVWLIAAHTHAAAPATQSAGYAAFNPLFYLGVILIVVGIASFTLRKWARDNRVSSAIRKLSRITKRADMPPVASVRGVVDGDDHLAEAYDLVISIHDEALAGRLTLSEHEQRIIAAAESLVIKELTTSHRSSGT